MTRLFRAGDVGVLRAARRAGGPIDWPDPHADSTGLRRWLVKAWQRDWVAAEVRAASPGLAHRVEDLVAGHTCSGKDLRRVVRALVRYTLRAASRPTPFGLFAGAAPATIGAKARVQWGEDHGLRLRPDAEWLADVVARLESHPCLRDRVPVLANNLVEVRGQRLAVPHGQGRAEVRHTAAVRAAMRAARTPIVFGELVRDLAAQHPDVRPALQALQEAGLWVGIAGNQTKRAAALLRELALPADAVATSAEWGPAKPDPAFFARVVELATGQPDEILYVGDHRDNDIIPAHQAGLPTALIRRGPWGHLWAHDSRVHSRARWVVDSLHELADLITAGPR